jgi:hypothetical protein
VLIFDFVNLYFNSYCNILDQPTNCCALFLGKIDFLQLQSSKFKFLLLQNFNSGIYHYKIRLFLNLPLCIFNHN